jgi:hypothetical protein
MVLLSDVYPAISIQNLIEVLKNRNDASILEKHLIE